MILSDLDRLSAVMNRLWPQMDETQIAGYFRRFRAIDIEIMELALAECRNTLRFQPKYNEFEAVLQQEFRPHYALWASSRKQTATGTAGRDRTHADQIRQRHPELTDKPDSYVLIANYRHWVRREVARQKITLAQAHEDSPGFSRLVSQCIAELSSHGYDYDDAKNAAVLIIADDASFRCFAERLVENDLPRHAEAIV